MTLELEIRKREKIEREKGRIEGKIELIKNLMKNMKISAEAAMEAAGIPKEEFPKYMTML